MEIKQLAEQLSQAINKFNTKDGEVKSLVEKVDSLERRLLDFNARPYGEKPKGLGEWDSEKQAKDFVDFCRFLWSRDHTSVKQMSEGTDSEGGYLVPFEFVPTLVRLIEVYGQARTACTVIPVAREEMRMPTLTSGITVYWVGENTPITASQPAFNPLTLTVKKLAALVAASSELLEDSTIGIANLISTLVAEAIAKEEDRVCFAGKATGGTDAFDGVLWDSTVTSVTMAATGETEFSDVTADYLLSMIDAIPTSTLSNARFWMNRTVFDQVRKLKDNNNNYIFNQPYAAAPGTIWGYPYTLSDSYPGITTAVQAGKAFITFGNLKYVYMADRKQLSAALSSHVGFASDQTYFRFLERVGFKVAVGEALVNLKTHA